MKITKTIKALYIEHLDKQVEKYWNIYHFNMEPNHVSHNNEGDAFKHCYMSAELTLLLGYSLAKKLTDKHENWEGNPENEKLMDLHNNEVGLRIGKKVRKGIMWPFKKWDDIIAEKVMECMEKNYLITKPVEGFDIS